MRNTRGSRVTSRPWLIVFCAIFACSWCGNQFSPLLIQYRAIQHYSSFTVNSFLGIYVLGLAPALLLAGALSDRFGRKPVLFAATVCAVLASLTLAFGQLGIAEIYVGRLLSGITVGLSLAAGTSWIKELSLASFDAGADAGTGARRSSLAFTIGSAAGALVAGAIAQFTVLGEVLPFVLHIAFTLPFLWLILRVPETSYGQSGRESTLKRLAVPSAVHPRFRRVVLLAAPWIFIAAAIAYGYLPVLLATRTGSFGLGYATVACLITLGAAALAQPLAKRIDSVSSARGILTSMICIVTGLAAGIITIATASLVTGLIAGFILGIGMGLGLASGLMEVQRMAPLNDLAGLTGVFYAVAYLGFLMPTILTALTPPFPPLALLTTLAVLAVATTLAVLRSYRRHLPGTA